MKTLNDVFMKKIKEANEKEIGTFCFKYRNSIYISVWSMFKYQEPVKLIKL